MENDDILKQAAKLKRPTPSPNLWQRIERELEQQNEASLPKPTLKRRSFMYKPLAAAAIVLLIGLSSYVIFSLEGTPESHLYTASKLDDIRALEQEYRKAINDLEKEALSNLDALPEDMGPLYSAKLTLLNEQIELCRSKLEVNPANIHLNKYMLAALNEKKETLKEILTTQNAG